MSCSDGGLKVCFLRLFWVAVGDGDSGFVNCWNCNTGICWVSGFTFSADEPTALIQKEGGPCAVIAPVQAFLIKALLEDEEVLQNNSWRNVNCSADLLVIR